MDEKAFDYTIDNLWRARRILDLAEKLPENTNEFEKTQNDLFGTCIVFIHATLEEFLRGVAIREWIKLDDENLRKALTKYPRLNSRNIKINLLDSIEQRGINIEHLIRETIEEFVYQEMIFYSYNDVKEFLDISKVALKEDLVKNHVVKKDFLNIDSLIKKRHKIVHQADCTDLSFEQVATWGKSLQRFIFNLSQSLGLEHQYSENVKNFEFPVQTSTDNF